MSWSFLSCCGDGLAVNYMPGSFLSYCGCDLVVNVVSWSFISHCGDEVVDTEHLMFAICSLLPVMSEKTEGTASKTFSCVGVGGE